MPSSKTAGGTKYKPPAGKIRPTNFKAPPTLPYGLKGRIELFVNEYLVDFNGTQAAIRAGYSPASAGSKSYGLLQLPKVKEYIEAAKKAMLEGAKVEHGRVIEELACIAFINPRDFVSWKDGELKLQNSDEIPDEIMRAIQSIEEIETKNGKRIAIKFHSKLEGLTLLMRNMGMLKEDVTISGGDKPIRIDHSRVEEARERIKTLLGKNVAEQTVAPVTKASARLPAPVHDIPLPRKPE